MKNSNFILSLSVLYLSQNFRLLLALFLFCLNINVVHSQSQYLLDTANSFVRSRTYEVDSLGTIYWKCDSMNQNQIFSTYKSYSGLQNNDSMHLITSWQDSIIYLFHNEYTQYYKGIKVENSVYLEHYNLNGLIASNGWVIEGLNLSNTGYMSESEALDSAFSKIDAELYIWNDTNYFDNFNYETDSFYFPDDSFSNTSDSIHFPVGELVYYNPFNDKNPNNYVLTWKFSITATLPYYSSNIYYINANTGAIVDTIPNGRTGTADHVYYGNVTIDTKYYGGLKSKFFLWANDDGRAIKTRGPRKNNDKNDGRWQYSYLIDDNDDNWGTSNQEFTSAHYVATEAWKFFKSSYGRSGLNNSNGEVRVEVFDNYNNAAYKEEFSRGNVDYIYMGRIDGHWLSTYDIMGHEFTHGVDQYCRKMTGGGETGALEESYGDIFGFMVERANQPSTWDWLFGEDALSSSNRRSFYNPNGQATPGILDYPNFYPAIYKGTYWYTGVNDDRGVHINCSVHDRWFNLLSVGGVQNGITVNGIGCDKAAVIAWYTMTNLVEHNETFFMAREHEILAARLIYGFCSTEQNETCLAWLACGVGNTCPCNAAYSGWSTTCVGTSSLPNQNQTSINSQTKLVDLIKIYPNPASNIVNINISDNLLQNNFSFSVLSFEGKIIDNIQISKDQNNYELILTDYSSGIYFIRLDIDNRKYTLKFVKE